MPGTAGTTGSMLTVADDDGSQPMAGPGQGCTQAQLRRFIKSRPYVPMHELRRRFELNGEADDVQPVARARAASGWACRPRESGFLGELVRRGEVGLELCHDPCVPMVVGVFAMRPGHPLRRRRSSGRRYLPGARSGADPCDDCFGR